MKTRLLIIFGISITVISGIVLLLFLNAYDTVISEYPPLDEEVKSYLSSKCSELALLHIQKHSSYLADVDYELMGMNAIGLPIFLDGYSLSQCVNEILEKRGFVVAETGTSQIHDTEERILPYVEDDKIPYNSDNGSIIDANNKFALDFYSYAKENDKNIFFSPISIMTAFAIAYEGANNSTANEMQEVFGFPIEEQERRDEFQSVLKGFETTSLFGFDSEYTLHMANAFMMLIGEKKMFLSFSFA